ncbi:hypothetical protein [uncultured Pseudodesulfovibrio sp.]|uniref:hypothetical protein n=1 Tax=uncultured Pseudodesulfovibrio sp. TaxID=2035858 RepID=UPI0029C8C2C1|nr:hypothetical protein [uncultured Pseudodesulfovibrio sp.]
MNRRQLAVLLIFCALALAAGAYVLLSEAPKEEYVVHREAVKPPPEDVKAPAWVDSGQTPEPDYTPAQAEAHNATPVPPKQEPEYVPQVIEVKEDSVVTLSFVEALSNFFLSRFVPADTSGVSTTGVSAKSVNMHFGQELTGFSVPGDDIRTARKAVLDYAFTPSMLKTLEQIYSPAFLAYLVDSATTQEREYTVGMDKEIRPLTVAETSEMLRLNANVLKQTASIFRIIANDPTITELAGKYLRSAKAVERANGQLQTAIADEKDTAKAGQRLKQAILQREHVKNSIVSRIKRHCPGCSSSEAFYIAQWAYRRVLGEPVKRLPTFKTASELLDKMSKRFLQEAAKLK